MKKIILLMVVSLIITTVLNVNAQERKKAGSNWNENF